MSEISRIKNLQKPFLSLVGTMCDLDHKHFPPRRICTECSDDANSPKQVNTNVVVYEATLSHQIYSGDDK